MGILPYTICYVHIYHLFLNTIKFQISQCFQKPFLLQSTCSCFSHFMIRIYYILYICICVKGPGAQTIMVHQPKSFATFWKGNHLQWSWGFGGAETNFWSHGPPQKKSLTKPEAMVDGVKFTILFNEFFQLWKIWHGIFLVRLWVWIRIFLQTTYICQIILGWKMWRGFSPG